MGGTRGRKMKKESSLIGRKKGVKTNCLKSIFSVVWVFSSSLFTFPQFTTYTHLMMERNGWKTPWKIRRENHSRGKTKRCLKSKWRTLNFAYFLNGTERPLRAALYRSCFPLQLSSCAGLPTKLSWFVVFLFPLFFVLRLLFQQVTASSILTFPSNGTGYLMR